MRLGRCRAIRSCSWVLPADIAKRSWSHGRDSGIRTDSNPGGIWDPDKKAGAHARLRDEVPA
ncbi:hypothetical protein Psuf_030270 [Phytohabitans suffuscus]|uniref:Uncharacterized protein n=1 Tax=Phytohabitans suffuscus TaxID=624315 RepID=A0A6F8YHV0_9ACTN|nr:hypothetical protein Psuf_030270 [Phytohabitans suffuscus]